MEWVELSLPAGALADEIGAILASTDAVAAAGVQVRGDEVVLWVPADQAEAAGRALKDAAVRLAAEGFAVEAAALSIRPAPPEAEWRDAWKRHFRVTRVGKRVVIVPSWETHVVAPGDVVLDLDPGRAFGTGAHASTRLCLTELERLHEEGLAVRRFADVGAGSGILSIAAAKLWPEAEGVAVDIDPEAVEAACENLAANRLTDRVAASTGSAGDLSPRFDLVVANIQADVLESLRDQMAALVAPRGAVVLSGLLAEQAAGVARRYVGDGLELARVTTSVDDPEWSAVLLRRTETA